MIESEYFKEWRASHAGMLEEIRIDVKSLIREQNKLDTRLTLIESSQETARWTIRGIVTAMIFAVVKFGADHWSKP